MKKALTMFAAFIVAVVNSGVSPQSTFFFYEPKKPNKEVK